MINHIIDYFYNINLKTSIEIAATTLTILYVFGASLEKRWSMIAGFIGSSLYIYIFFISRLYYESIINVYYAAIGLWGFFLWKNSGTKNQSLSISTLGIKKNIIVIIATALVTLIFILIAKKINDASAILDSIVFTYAIPATYMQVKKIIENWLYFIVLNFISIGILISQHLHSTVLLMVVLNVLAIFGFSSWFQSMKNQRR